MLGIGRDNFKISAYGKHPSFDDYLCLNMDTPLETALSSWVDRGTKSGAYQHGQKGIRSFRFWMLGIKKADLLLGIVKDSSDSMGRKFPLIVICNAQVKDRDRKWPLIFTGFETVFRKFENITASSYGEFKEFESTLLGVKLSKPDFENNRGASFSSCLTAWLKNDREMDSMVLPVPVFLDRYASCAGEPEKRGVFNKSAGTPGAVFLGGLPEGPLVAIYNRPLKTKDFKRLFNLSDGN